MKKLTMFSYSVISYAIAFSSLMLWILSISHLIPAISIDRPQQIPWGWALLKNIGLISMFGLHHSITARKPFKAWITRMLPAPIERSTFVLVSGILLAILVVNWEPIGGNVWAFAPGTPLYYISYVMFFTGWAILFISTFLINHFDLFGLRQTYLELVGKPYTELSFRITAFYKYVRHPLYFGGIVGLWATPVMSSTHLSFAILLTGYFIVGTLFEERDMIKRFGDTYRAYQNRTAMLIPFLKKKQKEETTVVTQSIKQTS